MKYEICFGILLSSLISGPARAEAPEGPLTVVSEIKYNGICDGSAAIRIDRETLLVAYDEKNSLYAFDLWGGSRIAENNIDEMLELNDGSKEMDIEGATVVGDKIWWIGSHGLDGDGDPAPNRRVLFSTNIPDRDLKNLEVISQPIDIVEVIRQTPEGRSFLSDEVLQRKAKKGGVNIEGLAAGSSDELVVGFRSPLGDPLGKTGMATVVVFDNNDGSLTVSSIKKLDLADRGVRDITTTNSGYMLLAGNVGSGSETELYRWDGSDAISAIQTEGIADLNPESVLPVNDQWLILSDDGKVKRLDDEAGDGDRKCDKIRKKNSLGAEHENVFFRGVIVAD